MRGYGWPTAPGKRRITVDIDDELLRRIEHLAVDWELPRRLAVIRLLEQAVDVAEALKGGE